MSGKPSGEDVANFIMARSAADRMRKYVDRGRVHKALTQEALNSDFVEAFRIWAADPDNTEWRRRHDDLSCELEIRNLEPPYHLVRGEVEKLTEFVSSRVENMTEEELSEADTSMLQEFQSETAKRN